MVFVKEWNETGNRGIELFGEMIGRTRRVCGLGIREERHFNEKKEKDMEKERIRTKEEKGSAHRGARTPDH